MATDGQTVKIKPPSREWYEEWKRKKAVTEERKKKASLKQRVSWRKFRISGAGGFAEGALRSAINRMQALIAELPVGHPLRYKIAEDINHLGTISRNLRMYTVVAINLAEQAESELMQKEQGE